jgi:hypothetical protein
MPQALLNDDQRRRVGTHLDLLTADLAALERLPELHHSGVPYEAIQVLVAEIRRRAGAMRDALDLPPDRAPSLKRQVAAVAGVWAAHLEDLGPKGLRAYGHVHPDLARHIEPHLSGILEQLYQLADAAASLPES